MPLNCGHSVCHQCIIDLIQDMNTLHRSHLYGHTPPDLQLTLGSKWCLICHPSCLPCATSAEDPAPLDTDSDVQTLTSLSTLYPIHVHGPEKSAQPLSLCLLCSRYHVASCPHRQLLCAPCPPTATSPPIVMTPPPSSRTAVHVASRTAETTRQRSHCVSPSTPPHFHSPRPVYIMLLLLHPTLAASSDGPPALVAHSPCRASPALFGRDAVKARDALLGQCPLGQPRGVRRRGYSPGHRPRDAHSVETTPDV